MVIRPKLNRIRESLGNKILCFLHYRYAHSEDVVFTNDEISDCIIGANKRHIGLALSELLERGLIDMEPEDPLKQIETGFLISSSGIGTVDLWSDDQYDIISDGINFLDDGREQLLDDIPIIATTPDNKPFSNAFSDEFAKVPASDRIVPLDHNGDPYKEAIRALEAVLQEFRKDHRSSVNHFDIEDRVLFKVLEAGRTLLDETEVYLETAENYLVRPLRRIIERYDQAIVGGLIGAYGSEILTTAKTALDAVLKLLGLG